MTTELKGKTFYLSPGVSAGLVASRTIRQNGGTVAFALTSKVDFFVVRDDERDSEATRIARASGLAVRVVSDTFLRDWIATGKMPSVPTAAASETETPTEAQPQTKSQSQPQSESELQPQVQSQVHVQAPMVEITPRGDVGAMVEMAYGEAAKFSAEHFGAAVDYAKAFTVTDGKRRQISDADAERAADAIHGLYAAFSRGDAFQSRVHAKALSDAIQKTASASKAAPVPQNPGDAERESMAIQVIQALVAALREAKERPASEPLQTKLYKALRCHVRPIALDSDGILKVDAKIPEMASAAFAVKRDSEHAAFPGTAPNQRMLFRAALPSELLGVLTDSRQCCALFRTGPLGRAAYFTDSIDAAARTPGCRFVAVHRVALGRAFETRTAVYSLTRPPSLYDSVSGPDGEFAIYEGSRQRLEYVIELKQRPSPAGPSLVNGSVAAVSPYPMAAVSPATVGVPSDDPLSPAAVKLAEDRLRELFVSNRGAAEISDLHVNCVNVLDCRHGEFDYAELSAEEASIPMILEAESDGTTKRKGPAVVSRSDFATAWDKFSTGQFAGMDWSHVVVAGGAVLAALLPGGESSFARSDIDMFVYGLSESEATEKLRHIYETVRRNTGVAASCVRTKNAVTILSEYPHRHVQVVLRIYKSPAEVVMGFDIDSCSVCYDGRDVWAIPRAKRAITKRFNLVDMSRRSLTYEVRLFKYAKRGFSVAIPSFEPSRVDPSLFTKDIGKVSGLAKLLLLQYRGRITPSGRQKTGPNGTAAPATGTSALFSEDRAQWEALRSQESQSDYADVEIPWGPYWTPDKITRLLDYRDKAQFFAHGRKDLKHRHLFVCGLEEALEGRAGWCKWCNQHWNGPVGDDSSGGGGGTCLGPVSWLTVNPGAQLLTGSFHPVSDDKWFTEAYSGDSDIGNVRAECSSCLSGSSRGQTVTEPLLNVPSTTFLSLGSGRKSAGAAAAVASAPQSSAIAAALLGDEVALEHLLRRGGCSSCDVASVAFVAARYGHTKCLRVALAATPGMDRASTDADGRTLLHLAVLSGNPECREFVESSCRGLDTVKDKGGLTAAGLTAVAAEVPRRYTLRDLRNEYPLLRAAASGDATAFSELLRGSSDEPAAVDGYGVTPLHLACINGDEAVFDEAVDGTIGMPRDCHGQTPLHYLAASDKPSVAVLRKLLGAHPEWAAARNWLSQTAVDVAVARLCGMASLACRSKFPPPAVVRGLLCVLEELLLRSVAPRLSSFPIPLLPPSLVPLQMRTENRGETPWCVEFLQKKAAEEASNASGENGSDDAVEEKPRPTFAAPIKSVKVVATKKAAKPVSSEDEDDDDDDDDEDESEGGRMEQIPKQAPPRFDFGAKKQPAEKTVTTGMRFGIPQPINNKAPSKFKFGVAPQPPMCPLPAATANPVQMQGAAVAAAFGQPRVSAPSFSAGGASAGALIDTANQHLAGVLSGTSPVLQKTAASLAPTAQDVINTQLAQAARNALGGFSSKEALKSDVAMLLSAVNKLFRAQSIGSCERDSLKKVILTMPLDPRLMAALRSNEGADSATLARVLCSVATSKTF